MGPNACDGDRRHPSRWPGIRPEEATRIQTSSLFRMFESLVKTAKQKIRGVLRRLRSLKNPEPDSASNTGAVEKRDMDSRDALHSYWRQPNPEGNRPAAFLDHPARSRALISMFGNVIPHDTRILEIGCGAGRNLAALHDASWRNLEGVEINPHAIKLLRKTYPQLREVTIHEGAIEDVLPTFADDEFNVVVSVSTLGHLHPDSVAVFDHLTRIAGQVFVIEGPPTRSRRLHPWDYDQQFTSRGMSLLATTEMANVAGVDRAFAGSIGRRFRRMDHQATLHEFWRQPNPQGNEPHRYVNAVTRSQALLEIIADVPKDARVLEIGCNVGRNLAYLHEHGYHRVEGIEINPHAVALLRETYPHLASTEIHIGAAGEVLPRLADDEFDLVYTMAVLEHIHPDEASVFDDMARIGRQILAIEPHGRLSHRQFPHDIRQVFGDRGLLLVSDRSMADYPCNARDTAMKDFYAFRFRRSAGWKPVPLAPSAPEAG